MIVSVCFISLTNVRRFTHFGKLRVYIGELLFKDGYLGEVLFKDGYLGEVLYGRGTKETKFTFCRMVIWERYYMVLRITKAKFTFCSKMTKR
jgi:hypothetical protein